MNGSGEWDVDIKLLEALCNPWAEGLAWVIPYFIP